MPDPKTIVTRTPSSPVWLLLGRIYLVYCRLQFGLSPWR